VVLEPLLLDVEPDDPEELPPDELPPDELPPDDEPPLDEPPDDDPPPPDELVLSSSEPPQPAPIESVRAARAVKVMNEPKRIMRVSPVRFRPFFPASHG
jgi:hypothetical protein